MSKAQSESVLGDFMESEQMVRPAASPVQSNLLDSGLRWVWGADITNWGEKHQMGCWAPGEQEEEVQSSCKNPDPTWEVKQANNRWDLVHRHFICSQLSTRYSWGGDCHSNGIWGAKGLSMATENLFVVLFGEFSLSFLYFPFFFPCFIIPFLQGPQIPSQCSVSFGKWRPIYTRYLRMCGAEIKHSPNSSKPPGVTFTEHCEQ